MGRAERPVKDWLDKFRRRFECFTRDHELMAMGERLPEELCIHIVCERCGKEVIQLHFHNELVPPPLPKGALH